MSKPWKYPVTPVNHLQGLPPDLRMMTVQVEPLEDIDPLVAQAVPLFETWDNVLLSVRKREINHTKWVAKYFRTYFEFQVDVSE